MMFYKDPDKQIDEPEEDLDLPDPFDLGDFSFFEQDLFNNLNKILEHQSFAFFKNPRLSENQRQSLDDLFRNSLQNKNFTPKNLKWPKAPENNKDVLKNHDLKYLVDEILGSFFDKKSWDIADSTNPRHYHVEWSMTNTNGKPSGFVEVNGKKYALDTLLKEPLKKDTPTFLPLVYFKPRINVSVNGNEASISIDARVLDEYLKSKNLSVKNLYFSSKYFQGEENKGFLDLAFNSPSLVLRHHLELDETQKEFFKKDPALESLNIDGHLITAKYFNEV